VVGPADEYLLVDGSGNVLEGTRTNFYAITQEPVLRTAGEGVLRGIARSIVLEIAPSLLRIDLSPPRLADTPELDEAFVTSSSRGIVPLVQINGAPVASGTPGPLTAKLIEMYDRRARELEEPL
jgi:branched-subunit amino acid aminotransferase/4-amino-4-deoxychorismate lyase